MSETIIVPVNKLNRSTLNVREKHSKQAVAAMAASIKANGIINPPSVTLMASGDYDVVAGMLRVMGADEAGLTDIDVKLYNGLSEAELTEISLAENVTRQEMTSLERFVAFQKLALEGRSVAEIGSSFDMTEHRVRQVLAIGSLPKKIIALVENDHINSDCLEVLTTATPGQLQKYLKLSNRNRAIFSYGVRQWLQKDNQRMPVSFALFDVSEYKGAVTEDLFADEAEARCFTDAEQFWKLQKPCIDAEVVKLKDAGWPVVMVDQWSQYSYSKASRKKGGKAYVAVLDSGQVIISKGFLPHGSTPKKAKATEKKAAPELTNPMQDYVRAHRHLAIQHALLDNHEVAIALAISLLLSGDRGWRTESEEFARLKNEKHAQSIRASDYRQDCLDQTADVIDFLDVNQDDYPYGVFADDVLKAASSFDHGSLLLMLSALVSERLQMSGGFGDGKLDNLLGELLGLNTVDAWKPDDAFWSGIRSRAALIGIIREIAPEKAVLKTDKSTLKDLREMAKKFIAAGGDRARDWRPRWMQFPAAAYTKEHGLGFVEENQATK